MGSMVMCLIGLLIRAEERRKQREKCSNVQMFTGTIFPHAGTRAHYYIRDTPSNGATNTGNININYDEGVFENILDDGE